MCVERKKKKREKRDFFEREKWNGRRGVKLGWDKAGEEEN